MATQADEQVARAEAKWVRPLGAQGAGRARAHPRAQRARGADLPVLAFTQRAAAIEIEKVLRSAVANAETNPLLHWDGDDLLVKAAYADEGPTLKRSAPPRARPGQLINKRTCHITIELAQNPKVEQPRARRAAAPAATEASPRPRPLEKPKRSRAKKKPEERRVMGQKVHPGGLRAARHPRLEVELVGGQEEFPTTSSRTPASATTSTASSAMPAWPTS